jgi:hypothetical protein
MPLRGSKKHSIDSLVRGVRRPTGSAAIRNRLTPAHEEPPFDPTLDDKDVVEIIGDRITAIVLNDEGPNVVTGYNQEPLAAVDLQSPPTELKAEDVLTEARNILSNSTRPSSSRSPPLNLMERKKLSKEHNQQTKRIHDIFDRIDEDITALSKELALFKEQPSRDKFKAIQSKFTDLPLEVAEWWHPGSEGAFSR